jgi:hypothetical protein
MENEKRVVKVEQERTQRVEGEKKVLGVGKHFDV